MSANYRVIYFGGPSSSGKSLFAEALQNEFPDPFLHIGIDKLIGMMPYKSNDWQGGRTVEGFSWSLSEDGKGNPLATLQVGSFGKQIWRTLPPVVQTLVACGHFVIIDDVPLEKEQLDVWKEALHDIPTLYVGMTAPVEVLVQRERERGDRMIGSARVQYEASRMDFGYDLILDTSQLSLKEQTREIFSRVYSPKEIN